MIKECESASAIAPQGCVESGGEVERVTVSGKNEAGLTVPQPEYLVNRKPGAAVVFDVELLGVSDQREALRRDSKRPTVLRGGGRHTDERGRREGAPGIHGR